MVEGKHKSSCGNGLKKYTDKQIDKEQKYSIPAPLIRHLFDL
jgi:hypothetical protein